MGANPRDIRRQIAAQRERMTPKLVELGGRLQEDVQDATTVARQRFSQVRAVADRGLAVLGGIFLAGLVIGFVLQGRRKDKQRDKLLQESVKNWPWRTGWAGRPEWPPQMAPWPGRK